ncbi:MAG: HD domain-containing phosphohydrolase [Acidimicrobiales bacterium]|jgi:hypothetical protein
MVTGLSIESDELVRLPLGLDSRKFLDSLDEGALVVNAEGEIVDANATAARLLDQSLGALLGRGFSDFLISSVDENGAPLGSLDDPVAFTLRTAKPTGRRLIGVALADGSRRWLVVRSSPLVVDGTARGAKCSMFDVTGRLKHSRMMEAILAIHRCIVDECNEADFLRHLCDAVVSSGKFQLAWVGLAVPDGAFTVNVAYAAGPAAAYPYERIVSWSAQQPNGLGPVGTAIRTGNVQVIDDVLDVPGFELWSGRAAEFGLASCVAVPFKVGVTTGALCVYAGEKFAFDDLTIKALEEIAVEMGFGLGHWRTVHRLEIALGETIDILARIIEVRDSHTAGHQASVGALGEAIATQLDLSPAMIKLIGYSGRLHDVGNISVPAEVLTRPGKLGLQELELVERHTVVGNDILHRASLPWPVAEVALHHHERMDGSGYPDGLHGGEISLPARIIAVADVVEAMSQDRSYRTALGIEIGLNEIERGAGTLYDVDVVAACIGVFEAGFTFSNGATDSSGLD